MNILCKHFRFIHLSTPHFFPVHLLHISFQFIFYLAGFILSPVAFSVLLNYTSIIPDVHCSTGFLSVYKGHVDICWSTTKAKKCKILLVFWNFYKNSLCLVANIITWITHGSFNFFLFYLFFKFLSFFTILNSSGWPGYTFAFFPF